MTRSLDRDVQNERPSLSLAIERIGVKGIRRRIEAQTSTRSLSYDVELDAFIDLPRNQRGAHMSRIVEAIQEAIEKGRRRFGSLNEFLEAMCRMLLLKNPYANKAGVEARTIRYFETHLNLIKESIPEAVDVKLAVSMRRGREAEWTTGITMEGLTVCPCAQAVYSSLEEADPNGGLSHTQRTRVTVEAKAGDNPVPAEWLVEATATAFSAPIISLLKRRQEYELIKAAFKNPMFVEDVVRHILSRLATKLSGEGFPPETQIMIEAESYESVHPFNAHVSTGATLSRVIDELASK
ncbi:MAG: hypothetical protein AYL33_003750 [Candidatus Bathyarchaeota archaeon B63]|nr:MAG: hypothetical protein AYL33_003750 [Candidatus Bathyarchaeota archaeon B63]